MVKRRVVGSIVGMLAAASVLGTTACEPPQNSSHSTTVDAGSACQALVTHRGWNAPRAWNGQVEVTRVPCHHVVVWLYVKSSTGTMYTTSPDSDPVAASLSIFSALENPRMDWDVCANATTCYFGEY